MTIIIYLLCGLLGLIFVTLAKMQSVKKDFAVANQTFVLKRFFEDEAIGIAMSIIFLFLMAITLSEWVVVKPIFQNYVKIIFTMGGAIGSWAFMLFLGNSKKFIRGVIDKKTDIADNKI